MGFGSGLPHTGSLRRARAHVCGVSGAPTKAAPRAPRGGGASRNGSSAVDGRGGAGRLSEEYAGDERAVDELEYYEDDIGPDDSVSVAWMSSEERYAARLG